MSENILRDMQELTKKINALKQKREKLYKKSLSEIPNYSELAHALGLTRSGLYAKMDKDKIATRKLSYTALKEGKLIKPIECSRCKKNKNLEMHHQDYSNPLNILWVCKSCHAYITRQHTIPRKRPLKHASVATYRRHKCRCELCIQAMRAYQRKTYNRLHKSSKANTQHNLTVLYRN